MDPDLRGTLQHRWTDHNLKPEILWSQFRRRFARGFEDKLEEGLNRHWYNPNDKMQRHVLEAFC